jgi:hypothetical protein
MPRLRGHDMDMFGMTGMTRGTAPPHPDRTSTPRRKETACTA